MADCSSLHQGMAVLDSGGKRLGTVVAIDDCDFEFEHKTLFSHRVYRAHYSDLHEVRSDAVILNAELSELKHRFAEPHQARPGVTGDEVGTTPVIRQTELEPERLQPGQQPMFSRYEEHTIGISASGEVEARTLTLDLPTGQRHEQRRHYVTMTDEDQTDEVVVPEHP